MPSIADMFRREGREEGEARGEARGRAATVLKQLTLKFGPLDEAVRARVAGASADELDGYTERVLFADRLEDVLG
jgi:hypothetical protein